MPEPFKNNFDEKAIRSMAAHFERVAPGFDRTGFITYATEGLECLELKARSNRIVDAMEEYLPDNFPAAADVLVASLAPRAELADGELVNGDSVNGIRGWLIMPVADYVARRGQTHLALSLDVLKEMTSRFSSEFAIRPFLHSQTEATLEIISQWVADDDEHVRRLVSEGTRPRLPWGMRLSGFVSDPEPLLPLLDRLKDDPSEYVRRSVANNLNDVAKDHADWVVDIARDWLQEASNARQRLVRHALRTLIKAGHPGALQVLGYGPAELKIRRFDIQQAQVMLGGAVEFDLELESSSEREQPLIIDYALHHRRADGKTMAKVFKWKTLTLDGGAYFHGTKRHSMKPITTRRYYAGEHTVEILVNGQSLACRAFWLRLE